MTDARFADADPAPLALLAGDAEDLTVISTLVQDAVLQVSDVSYDSRHRQLALLLNRFRWEDAEQARREDRPGQVDIRARRETDGRVCIEVRDDGPGLPPDLEPERTPSLGMKLMFGLVRHQLGGELTLENTPEGVLVRLRFRPHIAD